MVIAQVDQAQAAFAVGQLSSNGAGVSGASVDQAVAAFEVGGVFRLDTQRIGPAAEAATWTWLTQISAGNTTTVGRGDGVAKLRILEGESVTFRARPTTEDGVVVYRSSVQTAVLNVFDTGSPGAGPVFSEELVVESVMGTQLVVDKGWRADALGHTFKYVLPAGILIEGGHTYIVELTLRTFNGGPRSTTWQVETRPLRTSRASLGV